MPVVAAAGIAAVGSIAAGAMSSSASKSAARTQANAMREAGAETRAAADKARKDFLTRITPALDDYHEAMRRNVNDIKTGATDVMRVLSESTSNASDILSSAGANASMAILGSRAYNEGIPRQSFEESFARMDPAQVDQVMRSAQPIGEMQKLTGNFQPSPAVDRAGNLPGVAGVAGRVASGAMGAIGGMMAGRTAGGDQISQTQAQLTPEDFMADVPTGRMVKNPNYRGGDSWDGVSKPEEWVPYTDEERQRMGYEAYVSSGAEEKMRRARAAQDAMLTARGGRPPGLGEIASPRASDYLPDIQTGAYSGGPGYFTSVEALERGQREGLAALAEGAGIARRDITAGMDRIRGAYDPYTSAGSDAMRREAALSGALGPEEQQAAIDAFTESPGQKYLREQMERSLLRNTAAIGGLGGGNVRTALQEQAYGIAGQQQQQYLENLRSIAMRGQEATGAVAGYESSAASNLASIANALGINSQQLITMSQGELAALAERTGVRLADIQSAIGGAQAELARSAGTGLAGVAGSMTGDVTGMRERQYTTDLQAEQDIGTKLANLATISGTQSAQYNAGAGSSLATGGYLSGRAISEGLQGVANAGAYAMANLPQQQQIQPVTPSFTQPSMPWNQGTAPIRNTGTTAFGM